MVRKFHSYTIYFTFTLIYLNCINADYYPECNGIAGGKFIASLEACDSYLYCNGNDSSAGKCEPGKYFDGINGYCDIAENVKCEIDENESEDEDEEDSDDEDYSEEEDEDDSDENYEDDDNAEESTEKDINDNEPTVLRPTVTLTPTLIEPIVMTSCPTIDDPLKIVMIVNNKSCSEYYLCYHGKAIEMHCTDDLHFNAKIGKCDLPSYAQCSFNHSPTLSCLPDTTDFLPHPVKCNYFYYCFKGYLTVQQCPPKFGWDIDQRQCMRNAKCYKGVQ